MLNLKKKGMGHNPLIGFNKISSPEEKENKNRKKGNKCEFAEIFVLLPDVVFRVVFPLAPFLFLFGLQNHPSPSPDGFLSKLWQSPQNVTLFHLGLGRDAITFFTKKPKPLTWRRGKPRHFNLAPWKKEV